MMFKVLDVKSNGYSAFCQPPGRPPKAPAKQFYTQRLTV